MMDAKAKQRLVDAKVRQVERDKQENLCIGEQVIDHDKCPKPNANAKEKNPIGQSPKPVLHPDIANPGGIALHDSIWVRCVINFK